MTTLRRIVVWLLWPFLYEGQSLVPFGADTDDYHVGTGGCGEDVVRCDGGGKA